MHTPPKGIIFDLDGTLTDHRKVKLLSLRELAKHGVHNPADFLQAMKAIAAFRQAQELLRESSNPSELAHTLSDRQLQTASDLTNMSTGSIALYVRHWMEETPLTFLATCLRPQVVEFLHEAKLRRIKLAVVSDYPAEAKLKALGIAEYFDVIISAQDPTVNVFKPDPKGIRIALERLDLMVDEAIYIGDRHDVDALAAGRLGILCYIFGSLRAGEDDDFMRFNSYKELRQRIIYGGSTFAPANDRKRLSVLPKFRMN